MSKGVCVRFAKCFTIFMATIILVQGVGYLGLAVWGITIYNCETNNSDPVNKPFEFVLDLIYFSREQCGAPTLHIPEAGVDVSLQIDFAVANVITNREYIFLICYIAISALWVLTSFLVLVIMCCDITKTVAAIFFWPWVLCILAGSILDAVATGYHIEDIIHTTSATSTFEYVGVENVPEVLDYLKGYDVYFVTPAVAFTCISSRIVLIWLLNVCGAFFCLTLIRVISTDADDDDPYKRDQYPRRPIDTNNRTQTQRQVSQNERQMRELQQQDSVVLRYQPSAPPESVSCTIEPLKSPQEQTPPPELVTYVLPVTRQQSTTNNKRVNELKTQASIATDTPTYQSSDAHPENLDYPNNRYSSGPSSLPTPRSATPELSAISPLNMRYSTNEGAPFHSQPHVTQELRGQLPWSYTNIMNDPIAQKRIQAHLQPDDEEFPPIPVPDYTLHPPKKDRGPVNQDRQSQSGYSRW